MSVLHLVLLEIAFRKLNFALGVLSIAAAVAALVGVATSLRAFDQTTEAILAAKLKQTQIRTAKAEDDYRKLSVDMGFNVLILPKGQNLADFFADDFASRTMPESYADKLAQAKVATVNHILPSLQQKLTWPERGRTILLIGTRGEAMVHSVKQKPILEPVPPGTMVLGYELARPLKLAAGQEVTMLGRNFKVTRALPEHGNKDDISAWINLGEAQELLHKPGEINAILGLECNCAGDRLATIRQEISSILPDTQIVEFASQAIMRAETRNRAAAESKAALEQERAGRDQLRQERESYAATVVPLVVLASALAVGLLALANVRERAVELGILRAIGVRRRKLATLVLFKSVAMGLIGAALGCGLGWTFGSYLSTGAAASTEAAMPMLRLFDIRVVVMAAVAAPLLAAVASWLPALVAARQDPALVLCRD